MPFEPPHRPTIIDVAREAGVSKTTVSAALNGDREVAEKTRAHIQLVARRIGYTPNVSAASLRTKSGPKLGYSSVAIINKFINAAEQESYSRSHHCLAMRERLKELGHDSHVYDVGGNNKTEITKLSRLLYNRGFDGIIFDRINVDYDKFFSADWEPFSLICWGRGVREPPCDFIQSNYFQSVNTAWEEACKAGCRKIGVLSCRHDPAVLDDRDREGALAVCQAHMSVDQIPVPPFFGHPADWAGIKKWYRKYRPDVVVGFNLGHYYCLLEMGLRIPEDVKYIDLLKLEPGMKIAGVYHSEEEMRMKAAEHIDFLIRHKRKGIPKIRWGMLTPTSWGPGESLLL